MNQPLITRERMPPRLPGRTREQLLKDTLAAQVTACMMNAMRLENRASTWRMMGDDDAAALAQEQADQYADYAFRCVSEVLGEGPAITANPVIARPKAPTPFSDEEGDDATVVNPEGNVI